MPKKLGGDVTVVINKTSLLLGVAIGWYLAKRKYFYQEPNYQTWEE